jgi:hypothetical protein
MVAIGVMGMVTIHKLGRLRQTSRLGDERFGKQGPGKDNLPCSMVMF